MVRGAEDHEDDGSDLVALPHLGVSERQYPGDQEGKRKGRTRKVSGPSRSLPVACSAKLSCGAKGKAPTRRIAKQNQARPTQEHRARLWNRGSDEMCCFCIRGGSEVERHRRHGKVRSRCCGKGLRERHWTEQIWDMLRI